MVESISHKLTIDRDDLINHSLIAFLREKKHLCMKDRFEILSRYDVESIEKLESMIKEGLVKEHPTWEDLIELENIEEELRTLEDVIREVQQNI